MSVVTPIRSEVLRQRVRGQVVGMRVDVDESGRDHEARGVDDRDGGGRGQVADRGNPALADGHVGPPAGRPGPVHDDAAADQEVVGVLRRARTGGQAGEEQGEGEDAGPAC